MRSGSGSSQFLWPSVAMAVQRTVFQTAQMRAMHEL